MPSNVKENLLTTEKAIGKCIKWFKRVTGVHDGGLVEGDSLFLVV